MCDVSKKDPLEGYSDDEKSLFHTERYKIYNGTIAVCIIYSVIALILILIGYFTEWGRNFILGTILPFIVTYIIGTIIIIIILANSVSNYKPVHIDNRVGYDSEICPDYWKLEKTDATYKFSSNVNKNHFNYICKMNTDILNSKDIFEADRTYYDLYNYGSGNNISNLMVNLNKENVNIVIDAASLGTNQKKDFFDYAIYMNNFEKDNADIAGTYTGGVKLNMKNNLNTDKMYKYDISTASGGASTMIEAGSVSESDTYPLACDKVYPLYLSAMDYKNSQENKTEPTNRFRCAYAKACKIPWTDIGCINE